MYSEPYSHHGPNPPARERTLNGTGNMFNTRSIAAEHWLTILPESALPLVDIGACYGVHTLLALSKGRNVIAVDSADEHLTELRRRVEQQTQRYKEGPQNLGKLVGCVQARVPDRNIIQKNSVAGVLISEVMHFLQPGEPLQVFYDTYEWLCNGGKLIVSTGSFNVQNLELYKETTTLNKGRSTTEVRKLLEEKTGEELLDDCPGLLVLPDRENEGRAMQLYLLTTTELEAMARLAGFKVLECKYYSQSKYVPPNVRGESVLLIAEKSN